MLNSRSPASKTPTSRPFIATLIAEVVLITYAKISKSIVQRQLNFIRFVNTFARRAMARVSGGFPRLFERILTTYARQAVTTLRAYSARTAVTYAKRAQTEVTLVVRFVRYVITFSRRAVTNTVPGRTLSRIVVTFARRAVTKVGFDYGLWAKPVFRGIIRKFNDVKGRIPK